MSDIPKTDKLRDATWDIEDVEWNPDDGDPKTAGNVLLPDDERDSALADLDKIIEQEKDHE